MEKERKRKRVIEYHIMEGRFNNQTDAVNSQYTCNNIYEIIHYCTTESLLNTKYHVM